MEAQIPSHHAQLAPGRLCLESRRARPSTEPGPSRFPSASVGNRKDHHNKLAALYPLRTWPLLLYELPGWYEFWLYLEFSSLLAGGPSIFTVTCVWHFPCNMLVDPGSSVKWFHNEPATFHLLYSVVKMNSARLWKITPLDHSIPGYCVQIFLPVENKNVSHIWHWSAEELLKCDVPSF